MTELTHIDSDGQVRMVDVTDKDTTDRRAVASGKIFMSQQTFTAISKNRIKKGNVLETARIAGIMAAKQTSALIPMCHPVSISHAKVDFFPDESTCTIGIRSEVRVKSSTGVEMEALSAVSVAALTIYDMCKALDREMVISDIRLDEKSGGKSGEYKREVV